jgi:hypothetical protein
VARIKLNKYLEYLKNILPYYIDILYWFIEILILYDWRWARNRMVMFIEDLLHFR